MWPWGHLAVGYLVWSLYTRRMYQRPPRASETWVVIAVTQFPDLVDKPLAWSFSILPSGRSLAHSAFTLVLLSSLVVYIARQYDRPTLGVAFSAAYASHLLSDALRPALAGDFGYLGYLLWPLVSVSSEEGWSLVAIARSASIGNFSGYHGVALVCCVGLWLLDGAPGIPRRLDHSTE